VHWIVSFAAGGPNDIRRRKGTGTLLFLGGHFQSP
jgi:hypothetical protein